MTEFKPTLAYARQLDASDNLKHWRHQFLVPQKKDGGSSIYFVGNSLGLQPKTALNRVKQVMDAWAHLGVEGHFKGDQPWLGYPSLLKGKMAKVVGAMPDEVSVMNTLTVNLHLMLTSFFRPVGSKYKVVTEANSFPSDRYAVASHLRLHGHDPEDGILEWKCNSKTGIWEIEDLASLVEHHKDEIALLLLGGINYYTGQLFDLQAVTEIGHKAGIPVGLDLAHAAGNVLLQLHDWEADFAVWCTYKYLNSGPGGMAACFVHEKHAGDSSIPRFEGWWGHRPETRFQMSGTFTPAIGADAWQLSNPPILPLACLDASLNIFESVGMTALHSKSVQLTRFMEMLIHHRNPAGIQILTPKDTSKRGAQLSFKSDKNLFDRLSGRGIICDWREPDVIRAAPVPLYNTFEEVYRFVKVLAS